MFTLLKFVLLLDALILTIAVLLQAGQGGGLASIRSPGGPRASSCSSHSSSQ